MADSDIFAVLTGDIVNSSELNNGQGYPISSIINRIEKWIFSYFRPVIHYDIDVFRGDSWQMVVKDPAQSLRIGLFMRALLKSDKSIEHTDSRVSIGFGKMDYLPDKDISSGIGEAYKLSGSGLDMCQRSKKMYLAFPEQNRSSLTKGLNLLIQMVDFQTQGWTSKQSDVIAGALVGFTQQEIAFEWVQERVSQQAISQHLESAGWSLISETIKYFEAIIPEILLL